MINNIHLSSLYDVKQKSILQFIPDHFLTILTSFSKQNTFDIHRLLETPYTTKTEN